MNSGRGGHSGRVMLQTKEQSREGANRGCMAMCVGRLGVSVAGPGVGGDVSLGGGRCFHVQSGQGQFGGALVLNAGPAGLGCGGNVSLVGGVASTERTSIGGPLYFRAGHGHRGGEIALSSGLGAGGLSGDVALRGGNAFNVVTTTSGSSENISSGAARITTGLVRARGGLSGTIELTSGGGGRMTGPIAVSVEQSRCDWGGGISVLSGSGDPEIGSAGKITASAGSGSLYGGNVRVFSGVGTEHSGGDLFLSGGKSNVAGSGMTLVCALGGRASEDVQMTAGSSSKHKSGLFSIKTPDSHRGDLSGEVQIWTGHARKAGSGQLALGAGGTQAGRGGAATYESGSSGANGRGGALVQQAGQGSEAGGSVRLSGGATLPGPKGCGGTALLSAGSARHRGGALVASGGAGGTSQTCGKVRLKGGESEQSLGGHVHTNTEQTTQVLTGGSQHTSGSVLLATGRAACASGKIVISAGAGASGGSLFTRAGCAGSDGQGGCVAVSSGEASCGYVGGSAVLFTGSGEVSGGKVLAHGGESVSGNSSNVGLTTRGTMNVDATGNVHLASGQAESSGRVRITTSESTESAGGCSLSAGGSSKSGAAVQLLASGRTHLGIQRGVILRSGDGRAGGPVRLLAAGASSVVAANRAGSVTLLTNQALDGGHGGCVSACGGRASVCGPPMSGSAGKSRNAEGASALASSGTCRHDGGDVGLSTTTKEASTISGCICIASHPATASSSGSLDLASGAGGRAGGAGLCGGSSRDADGSGVAVRAGSSEPGACAAGGNVGAAAGHGDRGGDLQLAAGNGQGTRGGGIAVSSGASSAASTGRIAICSGDGSRGSGAVHVSSGEAGHGTSGNICLAIGGAADTQSMQLWAGMTPQRSGGSLRLAAGDGVAGGECSFRGGHGHRGGSLRFLAGNGVSVSHGDVRLLAGSARRSVGGPVTCDTGGPVSGGEIDLLSGSGARGGSFNLRSGFGPDGGARVALRHGLSSLTIDHKEIRSDTHRFFSKSDHCRSNVGLTEGSSYISMQVSDQSRGTGFALREQEGRTSAVACLPFRVTGSSYSSDSRIKREISPPAASKITSDY